jgi:hypothetical protein
MTISFFWEVAPWLWYITSETSLNSYQSTGSNISEITALRTWDHTIARRRTRSNSPSVLKIRHLLYKVRMTTASRPSVAEDTICTTWYVGRTSHLRPYVGRPSYFLLLVQLLGAKCSYHHALVITNWSTILPSTTPLPTAHSADPSSSAIQPVSRFMGCVLPWPVYGVEHGRFTQRKTFIRFQSL